MNKFQRRILAKIASFIVSKSAFKYLIKCMYIVNDYYWEIALFCNCMIASTKLSGDKVLKYFFLKLKLKKQCSNMFFFTIVISFTDLTLDVLDM